MAHELGYVVSVVGRTAEAQVKKSSTPSGAPATVEEIIEGIRERSPSEAEIAERILDWAKEYFAPKCSQTSFLLELKDNPKTFHPLSIDKWGRLWTYNKNIRNTEPFDHAENWLEFRRRLDDIPGVNFPEKEMYSSAKLSSLANDAALRAFLDAIAWSIEQVKEAASTPSKNQSV